MGNILSGGDSGCDAVTISTAVDEAMDHGLDPSFERMISWAGYLANHVGFFVETREWRGREGVNIAFQNTYEI